MESAIDRYFRYVFYIDKYTEHSCVVVYSAVAGLTLKVRRCWAGGGPAVTRRVTASPASTTQDHNQWPRPRLAPPGQYQLSGG